MRLVVETTFVLYNSFNSKITRIKTPKLPRYISINIEEIVLVICSDLYSYQANVSLLPSERCRIYRHFPICRRKFRNFKR